MADIFLNKVNELYWQVQADDFILYELYDKFSFRPDGFQFTPRYKQGVWDGYIHLYNRRYNTIPHGLLKEVVKYAKENNFSIALSEQPTLPYNPEWFNDLSNIMKFEPYDYQLNAVHTALRQNKALIVSPTGSGKSAICYLIVQYLLHNTDYRILITVPTTQLVEQLNKDFADYNPNEPFETSLMYAGKKDIQSRVVISTWQSVIKQPKTFYDFDCYICDEAHQADGKSITSIVEKLAGTSKIRIGMTGTLDGTKTHELQLRALFGSVVSTKTTKQLIDSGKLSELNIHSHILEYSKPVNTSSYESEIDYIISNKNRLEKVTDIAMKLNGNTLVLFNFVEKHGKPLFENAKTKATKYGKEVYYVSGETAITDREVIRQKFEKQNNVVLFASFGTFSAGINAPNLKNLLLAHPTKARIRTLQSIGRILRKAKNKNSATLFDLVDKYPNKDNFAYKHFIARLEMYESEKFEYKITKQEFKNE